MSQHNDILIPSERFTRSDYTALRAYLNRIPVRQIGQMYYNEDDLEFIGCRSETDIKNRLERLRDQLVQRAADSNPHLSELLRNARKSGHWSKGVQEFIFKASETAASPPKRSDTVSNWFKKPISSALNQDAIKTLDDLLTVMAARGQGWFRPIPRMGQGKALAICRWLQTHESSLGRINESVFESEVINTDLVIVSPGKLDALVPLDKMQLAQEFDGSQGVNRADKFCFISARNDLQAIQAYLYKYRVQEKTRRAYQKELERFLLWCIHKRNKPMSSILVDDCEAYKDFISSPPQDWIGPKAVRLSKSWKPFVGTPSPASQRYAVQAIRSFFEWLVKVRYLGGNPWVAVSDPPVAKSLLPMQIDKALPAALWKKLIDENGVLDQLASRDDSDLAQHYKLRGWGVRFSLSAQFRLARAALLLLGDSGLRREEAAYATRSLLKPVSPDNALWELSVLGKRNKWRTVFLPPRAIEALRLHWVDRGLDFEFGISDIPLLSPLVVPPTRTSIAKHIPVGQEISSDLAQASSPDRKESGFSPDGLYQMVKSVLKRIAEDKTFDLEPYERALLSSVGPHSFRHTFGTLSVAGEVPLDVVQKVLGHASLQTTTIYVQAEKQRSIQELGKFFNKNVHNSDQKQ